MCRQHFSSLNMILPSLLLPPLLLPYFLPFLLPFPSSFLIRPNTFAVITATRVFNLVADSSAEMHMWIGGLSKSLTWLVLRAELPVS